MEGNILIAFALTFIAGISTAIGGLLAFFVKRENISIMALGLGFSAGVMIYVSLVEMIPQSEVLLAKTLSSDIASWVSLSAFFIGIAIAALIDKFMPDHIEPEMLNNIEGENTIENCHLLDPVKCKRLKRVGAFTAMAIAIHNFPEGLATFMAGMSDLTVGISIATAIAIHNIPEGISVALPIYHATHKKRKAFKYAALSGMTEPLGAIIGYLFLRTLLNDLTFGISFAVVAGIMIYISFDELIPLARDYGDGHKEIAGIIIGMLVMGISLQLF